MNTDYKFSVKLNFSFFAVIAFMIVADTSGAAILSLTACLIHESGHLLAMAVCGAPPEKITFYGGGILLDKSPVEFLPLFKKLLIFSSGCILNLIVAITTLFMFPENFTAQVFSAVNLLIFLFNILPIGYFDGAQILTAVLERLLNEKSSRLIIRIAGIIFSVILICAVLIYCIGFDHSISLSLGFAVLYLILAQFIE